MTPIHIEVSVKTWRLYYTMFDNIEAIHFELETTTWRSSRSGIF